MSFRFEDSQNKKGKTAVLKLPWRHFYYKCIHNQKVCHHPFRFLNKKKVSSTFASLYTGVHKCCSHTKPKQAKRSIFFVSLSIVQNNLQTWKNRSTFHFFPNRIRLTELGKCHFNWCHPEHCCMYIYRKFNKCKNTSIRLSCCYPFQSLTVNV